MSDRTITITIDLKDSTNGKLGGLKNQLLAMDKAAEKLNQRFKSFASLKYNATVRLIDRVTEPASRINSLLKKIAGGVYNISLRVNDAALSGIRKIESALMRIAGKTYNIAVNLRGAAGQKLEGLLGGAAMGAGMFMPVAGMAGVGFGVANAIQASASFEQQMSKVQAIRQLSKDSEEMKLLTQQAKDLGMQTAWTRQQVGEAQYYQALAGWSTQNILSTTPHLLNMASAGGIDLGRASDIVTDAMTAFGLKPTETYTNKQGQEVNAAEHFIDMLTKMQAVSNTDISQAGEAFKYSANVIGSMFSGQSLQNRMQATEDAMIMTGLMANAGIKGSMAGTATRAVFSRMSSMNRNSYNALRAMGVEYQDANGNILMPGEIMRGLSKRFKEGIDPNQLLDFAETIAGEKIHADTRRKLDSFIEQTQKNGGKMGSADMAKMAAMLAGQEAMSGLLAVLMGDWDAMAEKMDNVNGTAKDMADTMMNNLAGSFTYLGSAWDAFQQDLFTGTAGDGLRNFVDALTELLTKANNLFKDGIDFKDFGAIIGDVINRLKNKFLELDGIGSILAGGALVGALMKITSLARGALNTIRGVRTAGGAAGGSLGAGQKVGTMHVTAGVVNINGKINGAGGVGGRNVGNQTIIDNYNRTKEQIRGGGAPPPPAPSRFSNMGSAAKGGAAFAAIFGALDIMSVKAMNAERLASATDENRAQILKENRIAEWEAGGGLAGSVVGGAIGAALGSAVGPLGTVIVGMIGSVIGDKIGRIVGHDAGEDKSKSENKGKPDYWGLGENSQEPSAVTQKMKAGFERTTPYDNLKGIAEAQARRRQADAQEVASIKAAKEATEKQIKFFDAVDKKLGVLSPFKFGGGTVEAPAMYKAYTVEPTPEQQAQPAPIQMPTIELPENPLDKWFNFDGAGERLSALASQLLEGFGNIATGAGELFQGIVETAGSALASLGEVAASALEGVSSAFTAAKDTVLSVWSEVPGFFSGILSGLGGAAEAAGSAIYSGLTSVIGAIIGAWEGAAATVSGIISNISAMGSSVGATVSGVIARVRGHAEGGFVTSPELAMIGERGAELILPLTDRERSLDLLSQASSVLGLSEEISPSGSSGSSESSGSGGVTVEMNVTFNISGENSQDIVEAIKERIQEIADAAATQLSMTLNDAHHNRVLEV